MYWKFYRNEPNATIADTECFVFNAKKQETLLKMVITKILK